MGSAIFFIFYGSAFRANNVPFLASPMRDIAAEMAGYFNFAPTAGASRSFQCRA
jgi:hypothetical protein